MSFLGIAMHPNHLPAMCFLDWLTMTETSLQLDKYIMTSDFMVTAIQKDINKLQQRLHLLQQQFGQLSQSYHILVRKKHDTIRMANNIITLMTTN